MSKGSRNRNKAKRDEEKRKRKAANCAHYAALRDSGRNSKRAGRAAKAEKKVSLVKHRPEPCGNIGCARCNPRMNLPQFASPNSAIYGRRFYGTKVYAAQ